MKKHEQNVQENGAEHSLDVRASRRAALRQLAWIAPAVIATVTLSRRAAAASDNTGNPCAPDPPGTC